MDKRENQPNPDDRSDNVDKLQDMIGDTLHNIDEAEDRMDWAEDHEKETIKAKNKRRREAVEGFRDEIQDEIEQ